MRAARSSLRCLIGRLPCYAHAPTDVTEPPRREQAPPAIPRRSPNSRAEFMADAVQEAGLRLDRTGHALDGHRRAPRSPPTPSRSRCNGRAQIDGEPAEPATLVLRVEGPAALEIQHQSGGDPGTGQPLFRLAGGRAIALRQAPLSRPRPGPRRPRSTPPRPHASKPRWQPSATTASGRARTPRRRRQGR